MPSEVKQMKQKELKSLAKERLSEKRYKHVKNVVDAAEKLAIRYDEDVDKAAIAGWLHDICKEESKDEMLRQLQQDDIIAQSIIEKPLPVWHGPCAAVYAKTELGIDDPEILSAVACHTTGKRDMSKLDKILFLADLTSAERDFKGVEKYRKLAYEDLDEAMLVALQESVEHVKKTGRPLDRDSVEALHYFEELNKQKDSIE